LALATELERADCSVQSGDYPEPLSPLSKTLVRQSYAALPSLTSSLIERKAQQNRGILDFVGLQTH